MRRFLVWCSVGDAGMVSNLFGSNREYDIVLHNYANLRNHAGEWTFDEPGEKMNVAGKELRGLPYDKYEAVAFLDDDLSFDTASLNACFRVGVDLGLDLWQPSLTRASFVSWPYTRQQMDTYMIKHTVRDVPMVEMMMPFFSKRCLYDALPTFDINESGWGLDLYMWPKCSMTGCQVLDAIAFGHYRKPERRNRVLRNGLTPQQELWIQQKIHDPENAPFFPPGYKREALCGLTA